MSVAPKLEKNPPGDKENLAAVQRGKLPAHPRSMAKPALGFRFLTRAVLGGIFLYSGAAKAGASQAFAVALLPFMLIPEGWAHGFAVALAWSEMAAGAMILLPRVYRIGAGLILLLSLLFICVLTWALANGLIVSCGCFGEDAPPSASAMGFAIGRDVAIAVAAAFVALWRNRATV
jgi:hypothetical protein